MKKLTLVVGAGASCEYGLPVGSALTKNIASHLDIKFDFNRQVSGDTLIKYALELHVRRLGENSINPHLYAAWRIRDSMPQAKSIDNFIDTQQGDEKIELCGKLAIVKAILDAERKSALYVKPDNANNGINYAGTSEFWLHKLVDLITENCRVGDLAQRLGSLSFIIFNYDRCIEHYLYFALKNFYNLSDMHTAELLNNVQFLHPYGAVGSLPWQPKDNRAQFGEVLHQERLLKNASMIKTFTEGMDPDSSEIDEIHTAVAETETLLFLGFAFHRLNMKLLTPPEGRMPRTGVERNFATAYGLSQSDASTITDEICRMRGSNSERTSVRPDLKCAAIFSEYTRGISLL